MNTNLIFEPKSALLIDVCKKYRVYDYKVINLNEWILAIEPKQSEFINEVLAKLSNFMPELERKVRVI